MAGQICYGAIGRTNHWNYKSRDRLTMIIVEVLRFFASSVKAMLQDAATKDKTSLSPRKQIMPKDLLKSLVGAWEGTCQTWFEPGKLADESKVKGEIRPLLDGRFFRHTY